MNPIKISVHGTPIGESGFILPWAGRGIRYTEEEIQTVARVMKEADPMTQGAHLDEFERVFGEYHGGLPAFATSSGAAALELAAVLSAVGPKHDVVVPAHTYAASAIPFARRGARLVWADIDPDMRVMTAPQIEAALTPRTKAVVVVHLYGLHTPMVPILRLAERHGFIVIEDCAQALGARYVGRPSGTHGHLACYSFHAQKNITTLGEGGMLMVKSREHARHVPGLRHNGHRAFEEPRTDYWIPAMTNLEVDMEGEWPHNFSIGEPQCALGVLLMKRLDDINGRRQRIARRIINALSTFQEIVFQSVPEGSTHVYHLLCARYDGPAGKNRDDLIRLLASKYKIQAVVQYHPLYRYPLFRKMGFGEGDCPQTDRFFDKMLSLPMAEWYGDSEIDYLIRSVTEALQTLRKGNHA